MRFVPVEKEQNNYSKCPAYASTAILRLFFYFNSVVFVGGGARIFLDPGRRVP